MESGSDASTIVTGGVKRPVRQRGLFVLPSLFTAANIGAGYYAITQSLSGAVSGQAWHFDRAAIAIAVAALFDGVDGRVARATNTTSDFGREFDSLADVIAFGVAPSLLAYVWGVRPVESLVSGGQTARLLQLAALVCFLFLISGACRLARFNVSNNPQPRNPGRPGRKYFVGMPIPAGAGVIAAVIHFERGSPIDSLPMAMVWTALIAATGFLMVSRWRFWSGKELGFGDRKPMRGVLLLLVLLVVVFVWSEYAFIVLALAYLVSGVLARLAYTWQRRRELARAS